MTVFSETRRLNALLNDGNHFFRGFYNPNSSNSVTRDRIHSFHTLVQGISAEIDRCDNKELLVETYQLLAQINASIGDTRQNMEASPQNCNDVYSVILGLQEKIANKYFGEAKVKVWNDFFDFAEKLQKSPVGLAKMQQFKQKLIEQVNAINDSRAVHMLADRFRARAMREVVVDVERGDARWGLAGLAALGTFAYCLYSGMGFWEKEPYMYSASAGFAVNDVVNRYQGTSDVPHLIAAFTEMETIYNARLVALDQQQLPPLRVEDFTRQSASTGNMSGRSAPRPGRAL